MSDVGHKCKDEVGHESDGSRQAEARPGPADEDARCSALERPTAGIFNIVDDEPAKVSEWLPYLAEVTGAKPPMRLPRWVGRVAAGEVVVSIMTQTRGSSNEKAKRELGWSPTWATWRDGFRYALSDATVASG